MRGNRNLHHASKKRGFDFKCYHTFLNTKITQQSVSDCKDCVFLQIKPLLDTTNTIFKMNIVKKYLIVFKNMW